MDTEPSIDLTVVMDQETDTLTVTVGKGEQPIITERYLPGQMLVRNKVTHEVVGIQLIGFLRNWTSGNRVCNVLAEHFGMKPSQILQLLLKMTTR